MEVIKNAAPKEVIVFIDGIDEEGHVKQGPMIFFGLEQNYLDEITGVYERCGENVAVRRGVISLLDPATFEIGILLDLRGNQEIIVMEESLEVGENSYTAIRDHTGDFEVIFGLADTVETRGKDTWLNCTFSITISDLSSREEYESEVEATKNFLGEFAV